MENDELHRLDLIGFDERTETWFVDLRENSQLELSRSSLEGLVRLYNSIHRGNPLHLNDHRTLHQIEESNRRLTDTVRDLRRQVGPERSAPRRLARAVAGGLVRLCRRK